MFNGDARDDAPKCHPETRRSIISDTKPWAISTTSLSDILWLTGPVGTGKSAIARRVCEELNEEDPRLLVGSFFFWRNDDDRNTLKAFVATISYRLSVVMPEVGCLIEYVLSEDPSILDATLEYQWNALVVKPLHQAFANLDPTQAAQPRSLIVIDGLDECKSPSSQRQVLQLLVTLRHHGLHQRVAFLIASRPEVHIQAEIEFLMSQHPVSFRLPHLVLTETSESKDDMRLILNTSFNGICRRRRLIIGDGIWPPEETVEHIIKLARGQFIYPLTIVRWLEEEDGHPIHRLTSIFEVSGVEKSRALAPLDDLYNLVLSSACTKDAGALVLPCLFMITNPRPNGQIRTIEYLGQLFERDCGYIRLALQPLHSVLEIPVDDSGVIKLYHTSFLEYLYDPTRSSSHHVQSLTILGSTLRHALRWAIGLGGTIPSLDSSIAWLHIPFSRDVIRATPGLLGSASEMNATAWLRECYLLARTPISPHHSEGDYTRFRQVLQSSITSEEWGRISNNYPSADDLFDLPLYKWLAELRSGLLTLRQTALFLHVAFTLSIQEMIIEANELEAGSAVVRACSSSDSILPEDQHTCKARKLIVEQNEWLSSTLREDRDWKFFLGQALSHDRPDDKQSSAVRETFLSIFTPLNVMYSITLTTLKGNLKGNVLLRCIESIRKQDTQVPIIKPYLMTLLWIAEWTASNHTFLHREWQPDIQWFIEQFGDLAPEALAKHWQQKKCERPLPAVQSDMVITLREKIAQFAVVGNECDCDNILGFETKAKNHRHESSTDYPSADSKLRRTKGSAPSSKRVLSAAKPASPRRPSGHSPRPSPSHPRGGAQPSSPRPSRPSPAAEKPKPSPVAPKKPWRP
ncbi:hypothetical protein AX16_003295 [Volvariella volvacea WC 439]|nr:hypothetical protein AX16_003295 [Volvariella volvacea WC 439]